MSAKQAFLDAGHNIEEIDNDKEIEFLQEDIKSLAVLTTLVSGIYTYIFRILKFDYWMR